VPSFVQRVDLIFPDDRTVRVVTNMADQLTAERGLGGPLANAAAEMGARVWYSALKRQHPDDPAARDFRTFVDQIQGVITDDERAAQNGADAEDNGLDPTRPAAGVD
jgi:hypothetical protein